MSIPSIRAALAKLHCKKGEVVEILFHPGRAKIEESDRWRNYAKHKDYHLSHNRKHEKQVLLSEEFQQIYENST